MRRLSILTLAASIAVAPVQAQSFQYDYMCSVGVVGACFSLSVTTSLTATGTDVQMSVINHEGSPGVTTPQPVGLAQISFWNVSSGPDVSGQATTTGTSVGSATPWVWRLPFFDPFARLQLVGLGFGANSPVTGCGVPSAVGAAYYQTCGPGSSFNLSYSLPFAWTPPANQGVTFSYIADVTGGGGRCDINASSGRGTPACVRATPPVQVPEPASAFLVGVGMLVLVGMGRRRAAGTTGSNERLAT